MERSLSKLHYQRNMKISKMSVNEQRKIAKYTERAAEADKIIDPLITVGATVAAVAAVAIGTIAGMAVDGLSGGGTAGTGTIVGTKAGLAVAGSIMTGLAVYKAGRGLYEGGLAGAGLQLGAAYANKALAGSGNALLNKLSLSGSYNYNSGFSGGVSINTQGAQEFERRDGLNFGINYNEQTGFGTTTGMTTGFFNLGYGISGIGHSSGTYGSANMGFTSGDQGDYLRSSFDFNYNFRDNSFGGGVSLLQDFSSFGNNPTYFDRFSTSLNWNSEAGFSNQIQYTLSNRGFDAVTGFMQSMGNNIANVYNGIASVASGMWNSAVSGAGYLFGFGDRNGDTLYGDIANAYLNRQDRIATENLVNDIKSTQELEFDVMLTMEAINNKKINALESKNSAMYQEAVKQEEVYRKSLVANASYIDFNSKDPIEQEKAEAMTKALAKAGIKHVSKDEMRSLGISKEAIDNLHNGETGFHAGLFKYTNSEGKTQYTLGFRGTDDKLDLVADFANGVGWKSSQYREAAKLAVEISGALKANKFTMDITGHSLGGGLASIASAATGLHATTFNAANVSERVVEAFAGPNTYPNLANTVDSYYLQGEILSNIQYNTFQDIVNSGAGLLNSLFGTNLSYNQIIQEAPGRRIPVVGVIGGNPMPRQGYFNPYRSGQLHTMGIFIDSFNHDIRNNPTSQINYWR